MSFTLLPQIKNFIWPKIKYNIEDNRIPSKAETTIMHNNDLITVTWEIIRNLATSDLEVSITVGGLPEEHNSMSGKLDLQLFIQCPTDCLVANTDITIMNWDDIFDAEYESLPEQICSAWNS